MAAITFQRNGNINCNGAIIGTWSKGDVWKEMHAIKGRDRSGNKLVHYFYAFEFNDGTFFKYNYTMKEMKELAKDAFSANWRNILKIANKK